MGPKKARKKSRLKLISPTSQSNDTDIAAKEKLPFTPGDEVLACWQDGLYYLAVVKTINKKLSKCQVSFEDDSVYWVLFRHIRTAPINNDELICSVCEKSDNDNSICICKCCFHGYHKKCHKPIIQDYHPNEPLWFCRSCVFSKATKAGGALKSGADADALRAMKLDLPYDLITLKWDGHHKCNSDEIYCYCAGPGLWYYKMLECQNCHQWFHEACLQCLEYPILLGDRFFYFVCAVCNLGDESDVAALVLYNLSLKYDKRCLKNEDIELFLLDNWTAMQCGNIHDTPADERMEKVVEIMKKQKYKFRYQINGNGIETWSLYIRTAPFPTKACLLREEKIKQQYDAKRRLVLCNNNLSLGTEVGENLTDLEESEDYEVDPNDEMMRTATCHQAPNLSTFGSEPAFRQSESPDDFSSSSELHSEFYSIIGDKRSRDSTDFFYCEPIEKRFVNYVEHLSNSISSYSGTNGRLACGEDYSLLGRRLRKNGHVDYLVQWSGVTPTSF